DASAGGGLRASPPGRGQSAIQVLVVVQNRFMVQNENGHGPGRAEGRVRNDVQAPRAQGRRGRRRGQRKVQVRRAGVPHSRPEAGDQGQGIGRQGQDREGRR